jgi:hypothetical protein
MSDLPPAPDFSDRGRANLASNLAFIGAVVLLIGASVEYGVDPAGPAGGFSLVEYRGQPIGRFIATALYWWLPVCVAIVAGFLARRTNTRAVAAGLCMAEGLQSGASAMGPLLFGSEAGPGFFLTLAGAAILLSSGVAGLARHEGQSRTP